MNRNKIKNFIKNYLRRLRSFFIIFFTIFIVVLCITSFREYAQAACADENMQISRLALSETRDEDAAAHADDTSEAGISAFSIQKY